MEKIPLLLLNGSLGSGKTTLVKRLVKSPEFAGAFIIENEYANVNIDREALADEHDHEIYEISGNCVCCSTGEELEAALETIVAKKWAKPVILEATGMANSAILLRRLFLNPYFTEHFHILGTILMIDAAEVTAEQLDQTLTLEAKLSDVIVINKSDLAPTETEELRFALAKINPDASVVAATQANIDIDLLNQNESNVEVSFARVFPELSTIEPEESSYAVLDFDHPLDPERVRKVFETKSFGPEVRLRRAKGFFVDDLGQQWQLEATAKHMELTKLKKPKPQVIVAIGDGVNKTALREALL
jgi:G3E family GTPase